jgi:hypothetical protein
MAISDAIGTLTTAETRAPVTQIVLVNTQISGRQSNVILEIEYLDSNGVAVRGGLITLSSGPEVSAFLDALAVPLAGETGGIRRRTNYRALSHLLSTGKLPTVSSVTP